MWVFALGSAAYLTDVSAIPEESFALLEGLDLLVLSALRHKPHPSHATVEQAVGWSRRIGARQTWLTHIAHELGHEETNRALPAGRGPGLRRPDGACDPMSDSADGMIPIYRSAREIAAGLGPSVAVIGNFDGVHLGHRENLRAVVEDARRRGARAVALHSILIRNSFCVRRRRRC